MVSEFMLQQTPVERVLRPWRDWVDRWPTPAALAGAPSGEAVRAWGRLGYPRRALRLHQAAVAITANHGGKVPQELDALRALPGVGSYTAAAISSFAFGQRHVVLDTNVRRVLTRVADGMAYPGPAPNQQERLRAESFLPRSSARASRWAVASMELGALVCTARSPRCSACPVQQLCRWRELGCPAWEGPLRRGQAYAGTDRQCRGAILGVLRSSDRPVSRAELVDTWPDPVQQNRALESLLSDGLAVVVGSESIALPR
jgi:A/G-specific adenine glycosylase